MSAAAARALSATSRPWSVRDANVTRRSSGLGTRQIRSAATSRSATFVKPPLDSAASVASRVIGIRCSGERTSRTRMSNDAGARPKRSAISPISLSWVAR
jgi:hypothetical protein